MKTEKHSLASSPPSPAFMARPARSHFNGGRAAALVWTISALLFLLTFRFLMDHASDTVSPAARRSALYDRMSRDLEEHGAAFLNGGETSQSLSISDLFDLTGGHAVPMHKVADPPVRANVLFLPPDFAERIWNAVGDVFVPYFEKVIWFQNASMYHFSMFHASHHLTPVIATADEIEAEANAVKAVAETLCPLKIVLDRVVLTSTGVLLGCWEVISGPDPFTIREKLRLALPRAPGKQLYDPVMLHTSFARILGQPTMPLPGMSKPYSQLQDLAKPSDQLQLFHELVAHVNENIRGFEAFVSEMWYVEEYDVLALAVNGRMKVRRFQFSCSRG